MKTKHSTENKNGVAVLPNAPPPDFLEDASKFETFAQLGQYIAKPLILYRLRDREIVFANGPGLRFLREVFTENDHKHAGSIFLRVTDLHGMEKILLKSKSHVMRNVSTVNKSLDIQTKNIVSRLHQLDQEMHVFMIFWDVDSR
jgi:hypothetical protein